MTESSKFEIRPYRPGDEQGILESFNVVFREVCGEGFEDRSLAFWRWQFAENPCGHRISVAVTADGVIAAHYAGVPYGMATKFGECTFIHIVDSFVHPAHRKGLKKTGLFIATALPWFEDCEARGDAVLYGYPVKIAERIGQRYLSYQRLRVVDYLCRGLEQGSEDLPAGIEVSRIDAFDAEADALFARVAAEKPCLTKRDAAYLSWRWLRIPNHDYEVFAARREGTLSGLMVLRPVHELVPGACTIADWVVPEEDAPTADALLATATARGRAQGRSCLMAVFADPSPEYARLCAQGFSVVPSSTYLERRLTHRIFDRRMTSEWLAEHWWYTLGDSDLV